MTLVGYGTEDGMEYWKLANSHGKHFGTDGCIKFCEYSRKQAEAVEYSSVLGVDFTQTDLIDPKVGIQLTYTSDFLVPLARQHNNA